MTSHSSTSSLNARIPSSSLRSLLESPFHTLSLAEREREIVRLTNLGLGTFLYLSSMKIMVFVFSLLCLLAIPQIAIYSRGDRVALQPLGFTTFPSVLGDLTTVTHLTMTSWTPGGENYCNGHGFSALACPKGGWGGGVYDYACGFAPDSLAPTGTQSFVETYGFIDSLQKQCTNPVTLCMCMPGWGGDTCATVVNGTSALVAPGVSGWCSPVSAILPTPGNTITSRTPTACSGNGQCVLSRPTLDATAFTFCRCDQSWYGPTCNQSDTEPEPSTGLPPTYFKKQFVHRATTRSSRAQCATGSMSDYHLLLGTVLVCGTHGFKVRLPTDATGLMTNHSSFYRFQTPGVCACAGGYTGEQCLGSGPLPPVSSGLAGGTGIVLALGFVLLYRYRKLMEAHFRAIHVTPRDFSVFVDNIPPTPVSRAGAVKEHFSRWGPVYSFTPALDDEWLRFWQTQKNDALRRMRMAMELDEHARLVRLAREGRRRKSEGEGGEDHQSGGEVYVDPVLLPPLEFNLAVSSVDVAQPMFTPLLVACSIPGLKSALLSSRYLLHAYLRGLNAVIGGKLANEPGVRTFCRGFVTFEKIEHARACLKAYERFSLGGGRRGEERDGGGGEVGGASSAPSPSSSSSSHEMHAGGGTPTTSTFINPLHTLPGTTTGKQQLPLEGKSSPFHSHSHSHSHPHDKDHLNPHRMLYQGKHRLQVKHAIEPEAVIWDSLDNSLLSRRIRSMLTVVLVVVVLGVLLYGLQFLPQESNGSLTTLSAFMVVVITQLCAIFWRVVTYYLEQPISAGEKSLSMYYKTLATQVFVMVAANLGAYGLPVEANNGYLTDFYSGAGAFMLQVAVIETFLPPAIYFAMLDTRLARVVWGAAGSVTLQRWVAEPPPFGLEERCASLMRVVLMCCIFSPGVPILVPTTVLLVLIQWLTDRHLLYNLYRVQTSDGALIRGMEAVMVIGAFFNITMAVVVLKSTGVALSSNSLLNLAVFWSFVGLVAWALSGMLSYRLAQRRDCCCGGLLWVLAALRLPYAAIKALESTHSLFLLLIFGPAVFHMKQRLWMGGVGGSNPSLLTTTKPTPTSSPTAASGDRLGEPQAPLTALERAQKANYSDLALSKEYADTGLLPQPYALWERAQLGLWGTPGLVYLPRRPYLAREFDEVPVRRRVGRHYDAEHPFICNTFVRSTPFVPSSAHILSAINSSRKAEAEAEAEAAASEEHGYGGRSGKA